MALFHFFLGALCASVIGALVFAGNYITTQSATPVVHHVYDTHKNASSTFSEAQIVIEKKQEPTKEPTKEPTNLPTESPAIRKKDVVMMGYVSGLADKHKNLKDLKSARLSTQKGLVSYASFAQVVIFHNGACDNLTAKDILIHPNITIIRKELNDTHKKYGPQDVRFMWIWEWFRDNRHEYRHALVIDADVSHVIRPENEWGPTVFDYITSTKHLYDIYIARKILWDNDKKIQRARNYMANTAVSPQVKNCVGTIFHEQVDYAPVATGGTSDDIWQFLNHMQAFYASLKLPVGLCDMGMINEVVWYHYPQGRIAGGLPYHHIFMGGLEWPDFQKGTKPKMPADLNNHYYLYHW